MKNYYCWRCKTIIPFLDEKEWEVIEPILSDQIALIKDLRKKEKIDIAEAQSRAQGIACEVYNKLTGYNETNYLAIYHHRLADYGIECPKCNHLFRTPNAKFCANCGYVNDKESGHPTTAST